METLRLTILRCVLASACFLSVAQAKAAFSISANVDKTTVRINDSLQLEVRVQSGSPNVPEPHIPQINGFEIYSSGRSQNISFINGRFSSSITFTYNLVPRFLGKIKIPPITVRYKGRIYSTQEIEINVVKGAISQTQSQKQRRRISQGTPKIAAEREKAGPVFLTAETDKKSAYVNEQITLTVRFFTAVPLVSNPEYNSPPLKGFISEDLPPVRNGQTSINGKPYYYNEIKTALFPLESGYGEIGKARVKAVLQTGLALDVFDPNFFQRFFSGAGLGGGKLKILESAPLKIKIKPLPSNAPPSFTGAVGEYKIYSKLDRDSVHEGETINFSVIIEGKGNLKAVSAPKMPSMPAFKVYDVMSSLSVNKRNDIISGRKSFIAVMLAKKKGEYTLPPVKFAFFNPGLKKYVSVQTKPHKLKVLHNPNPLSSSPGYYPRTEDINPRINDIQYIFENLKMPFHLKAARKISSLNSVNFVFLLFVAFCGLYSHLRNVYARDPRKIKMKQACKKAKERLKKAEKLAEKEKLQEAISEIYDMLNDYISDKLGLSASSFTLKKIINLVKETKPYFSDRVLAEFRNLWNEIETSKFAGGSLSRESLRTFADRSISILQKMEEEFEK